jgi:hypothetical protein
MKMGIIATWRAMSPLIPPGNSVRIGALGGTDPDSTITPWIREDLGS